jgi:hypothetical protein
MDNIVELVDALGNVLKTKTPDIEKALESLASAMKETVTKITEIKAGREDKIKESGVDKKAVEALVDLITDKESKIKEFTDYLETKLPTAFEELTENLDEVKTGLQETAQALEDIRNRASARGTKKKAATPVKGDGCPCESILTTIANSVDAVHKIVSGTGVKVEDQVIKLLKGINSYSKGIRNALVSGSVKVPTSKGGGRGPYDYEYEHMGPPEPTSMSEPVGPKVRDVRDVIDASPDMMGGGADVLEKEMGETSTYSAEVEKALKGWLKYARTINFAMTYLGDAVGNYVEMIEASGQEDKAQALEKSYRMMEHTINNIVSGEYTASVSQKKQLKQEMLRMKVLSDLAAKGKVSTKQLEEQYKKINNLVNEINYSVEKWRSGLVLVNTTGGLLLNSFKKFSTTIFGGLIGDLNDWERESTRMAATMTGAIHKAGGESQELVARYRDLLKVSNEVIEQTHQFPRIIRKEWIKSIQKGTRTIHEAKEAVNSALAASWQVGSSAEGTAEEFQKWNMQLGMSAQGSASLARTMSSVAKTTGVMGDNLLHAVSAAREIAQLMKDTGLYSQQTADSVVSWMASAQKFGVDKQVQNIFRAAQGGLEAFNEASSETRNLLASSGQLQNVLVGQADPQDVMKGVGDAIRNAIPSYAFNKKDSRGRPAGLPDLKKLSKAEISRIDLIMKKRFGMKLGESVRLLEGIQDQNPEEKLADIDKQLGDSNSVLTKSEIESLKLQRDQLEVAKNEKNLNKILDSLGMMADAGKDQGATLASMLRAGKMTEASFTEAVNKGTDLLAKKMERQGKKFEDLQIKDSQGNVLNQQQLQAKMSQLVQGIKSGDMGSIREFRELQQKISEANKTADSSAKNASNNADQMETDQQKLQNTLQNLAKPLHTMAFQAPIWSWYLIAISGAVWGIYRMWRTGRVSENMQKTADTLINTIGTKGSGWVHDPYVERFVQNIDRNLVGLGKHLTKGKFGGKRAEALVDHTKTNPDNVVAGVANEIRQKFDSIIDPIRNKFIAVGDALKERFSLVAESVKERFGMAAKGISEKTGLATEATKNKVSKLTGGTTAAEEVKQAMPVKAVTDKTTKTVTEGANKTVAEATKTVTDKTATINVAKATINVAKATKNTTEGANKTVAEATKTKSVSGTPVEKRWIDVRGKKERKALKEEQMNAFLERKVLKRRKDIDKDQIKIPGEKVTPPKAKLPKTKIKGNDALLSGAAKIAAIAAGVVALGVVLVLAAKTIMNLTGFDAKQAQEVAWVIGVVIGAGAGVLLAAAAAAKVMKWASDSFSWKDIGSLYKGGAILAALLPGIILLGGLIVGMGAILNYFMSPKQAKDYAMAVAGVLGAAGIIALAVVAAAAGLAVLGILAGAAKVILPLMLAGAFALVLLTPAMIGLAWAVTKIAGAIQSHIDLKEASETAQSTASIMKSAGIIAGSVLLGAASLTILGAMVPLTPFIVPLMWAGTKALLILIPAITGLAWAVIKLAGVINGVIDIKDTDLQSVKKISEILWAAAKIAGAVVIGAVGLTALGSMSALSAFIVPLMLLGATALLILIPAITGLAWAVIKLAEEVNKSIGIDPGTADNIASATASILQSAGKIAGSVLLGAAALTALGSMTAFAWVAIPLMALGTAALMALTPTITGVALAVISMAQELVDKTGGVEKGKKTAEDLSSILESAAKISGAVVDSKKNLELLGLGAKIFSFFGSVIGGGAEELKKLTPQMTELAKSIIDLANQGLKNTGDNKGTANKLAELLESAAKIAAAVVDSKASLQKLSAMNTVTSWLSKVLGNSEKALVDTAKGIIDGIIVPIMRDLPPSKDINDTAAKLKGLLNALELLPKFISELSTKMASLSESKGLNKNLDSDTDRFSKWFYTIGTSLTTGVIQPITDGFPSIKTLQQAESSLKNTTALMDHVDKFVEDLAARMINFSTSWWWSSIDLIRSSTVTFSQFFKGIAFALTDGIANPVIQYFPKPETLQMAGKKTAEMNELVKKVTVLVDNLSTNLTRFASGWWWASPIARIHYQTETFAWFFTGIARALTYGVAYPILNNFPEVDQLKKAESMTEEMGGVVKKATALVDLLSENLTRFTTGWWWTSPVAGIARRTSLFSSYFKGIAVSLREGVIEPILENFPDSSEVEQAVNTLGMLIDALDGLSYVMDELTTILDVMSDSQIDFAGLKNVGGIFKAGELKFSVDTTNTVEQNQTGNFSSDLYYQMQSLTSLVTDNLFGNSNKTGESDQTQDWMDKILGVFTGLRSPAISANAKFLRSMSKNVGSSIEKPIGGIEKATGKVGTGVNRLGGAMNKFANQTEELPNGINSMKDLLHDDLVVILNQMKNAPVGGDSLQSIKKDVDAIKVILTDIKSSSDKIDLTGISTTLTSIHTQLIAVNDNLVVINDSLSDIKTSNNKVVSANNTITEANFKEVTGSNFATNNTLENNFDEIKTSVKGFSDAGDAIEVIKKEATSGTSLDTHDHTAEDLLKKVIGKLDGKGSIRPQANPNQADPVVQNKLEDKIRQQGKAIQHITEQRGEALQDQQKQQRSALDFNQSIQKEAYQQQVQAQKQLLQTQLDQYRQAQQQLLQNQDQRFEQALVNERQRLDALTSNLSPAQKAAAQQFIAQQEQQYRTQYAQQRSLQQKVIDQQIKTAEKQVELQIKSFDQQSNIGQKILDNRQKQEQKALQLQQNGQQRALDIQNRGAQVQNQQLQEQANKQGKKVAEAYDRPYQKLNENLEKKSKQALGLVNRQESIAVKDVEKRYNLFDRAAKRERDQVVDAVELRRRALGKKITQEQNEQLNLIAQQARERYDLRIQTAAQEKDTLIDGIKQQGEIMKTQIKQQTQEAQRQIDGQMLSPPVRSPAGDFPQKKEGEALVNANKALQSLEHEATSGTSIDTHDHALEDLMLNKGFASY